MTPGLDRTEEIGPTECDECGVRFEAEIEVRAEGVFNSPERCPYCGGVL